MKGTRRARRAPRGDMGFAALTGSGSSDSMRGVITGFATRTQNVPPVPPSPSRSDRSTGSAAPRASSTRSMSSSQAAAELDDDWGSLLNGSAASPSRTSSKSRRFTLSPPVRTEPTKEDVAPALALPATSSKASAQQKPQPQAPPADVPSFLSGWDGADGWGDDPALDDNDAAGEDDGWDAWPASGPYVVATAVRTPHASPQSPPKTAAPPARASPSAATVQGWDAAGAASSQSAQEAPAIAAVLSATGSANDSGADLVNNEAAWGEWPVPQEVDAAAGTIAAPEEGDANWGWGDGETEQSMRLAAATDRKSESSELLSAVAVAASVDKDPWGWSAADEGPVAEKSPARDGKIEHGQTKLDSSRGPMPEPSKISEEDKASGWDWDDEIVATESPTQNTQIERERALSDVGRGVAPTEVTETLEPEATVRGDFGEAVAQNGINVAAEQSSGSGSLGICDKGEPDLKVASGTQVSAEVSSLDGGAWCSDFRSTEVDVSSIHSIADVPSVAGHSEIDDAEWVPGPGTGAWDAALVDDEIQSVSASVTEPASSSVQNAANSVEPAADPDGNETRGENEAHGPALLSGALANAGSWLVKTTKEIAIITREISSDSVMPRRDVDRKDEPGSQPQLSAWGTSSESAADYASSAQPLGSTDRWRLSPDGAGAGANDGTGLQEAGGPQTADPALEPQATTFRETASAVTKDTTRPAEDAVHDSNPIHDNQSNVVFAAGEEQADASRAKSVKLSRGIEIAAVTQRDIASPETVSPVLGFSVKDGLLSGQAAHGEPKEFASSPLNSALALERASRDAFPPSTDGEPWGVDFQTDEVGPGEEAWGVSSISASDVWDVPLTEDKREPDSSIGVESAAENTFGDNRDGQDASIRESSSPAAAKVAFSLRNDALPNVSVAGADESCHSQAPADVEESEIISRQAVVPQSNVGSSHGIHSECADIPTQATSAKLGEPASTAWELTASSISDEQSLRTSKIPLPAKGAEFTKSAPINVSLSLPAAGAVLPSAPPLSTMTENDGFVSKLGQNIEYDERGIPVTPPSTGPDPHVPVAPVPAVSPESVSTPLHPFDRSGDGASTMKEPLQVQEIQFADQQSDNFEPIEQEDAARSGAEESGRASAANERSPPEQSRDLFPSAPQNIAASAEQSYDSFTPTQQKPPGRQPLEEEQYDPFAPTHGAPPQSEDQVTGSFSAEFEGRAQSTELSNSGTTGQVLSEQPESSFNDNSPKRSEPFAGEALSYTSYAPAPHEAQSIQGHPFSSVPVPRMSAVVKDSSCDPIAPSPLEPQVAEDLRDLWAPNQREAPAGAQDSYDTFAPAQQEGPPVVAEDLYDPFAPPQQEAAVAAEDSYDPFAPTPPEAAVAAEDSYDSFGPTPQEAPVAAEDSHDASAPTAQESPVVAEDSYDPFAPTPQEAPVTAENSYDSFAPTPQEAPVAVGDSCNAFSPTPQEPPVSAEDSYDASTTTPQAEPVVVENSYDAFAPTPQEAPVAAEYSYDAFAPPTQKAHVAAEDSYDPFTPTLQEAPVAAEDSYDAFAPPAQEAHTSTEDSYDPFAPTPQEAPVAAEDSYDAFAPPAQEAHTSTEDSYDPFAPTPQEAPVAAEDSCDPFAPPAQEAHVSADDSYDRFAPAPQKAPVAAEDSYNAFAPPAQEAHTSTEDSYDPFAPTPQEAPVAAEDSCDPFAPPAQEAHVSADDSYDPFAPTLQEAPVAAEDSYDAFAPPAQEAHVAAEDSCDPFAPTPQDLPAANEVQQDSFAAARREPQSLEERAYDSFAPTSQAVPAGAGKSCDSVAAVPKDLHVAAEQSHEVFSPALQAMPASDERPYEAFAPAPQALPVGERPHDAFAPAPQQVQTVVEHSHDSFVPKPQRLATETNLYSSSGPGPERSHTPEGRTNDLCPPAQDKAVAAELASDSFAPRPQERSATEERAYDAFAQSPQRPPAPAANSDEQYAPVPQEPPALEAHSDDPYSPAWNDTLGPGTRVFDPYAPTAQALCVPETPSHDLSASVRQQVQSVVPGHNSHASHAASTQPQGLPAQQLLVDAQKNDPSAEEQASRVQEQGYDPFAPSEQQIIGSEGAADEFFTKVEQQPQANVEELYSTYAESSVPPASPREQSLDPAITEPQWPSESSDHGYRSNAEGMQAQGEAQGNVFDSFAPAESNQAPHEMRAYDAFAPVEQVPVALATTEALSQSVGASAEFGSAPEMSVTSVEQYAPRSTAPSGYGLGLESPRQADAPAVAQEGRAAFRPSSAADSGPHMEQNMGSNSASIGISPSSVYAPVPVSTQQAAGPIGTVGVATDDDSQQQWATYGQNFTGEGALAIQAEQYAPRTAAAAEYKLQAMQSFTPTTTAVDDGRPALPAHRTLQPVPPPPPPSGENGYMPFQNATPPLSGDQGCSDYGSSANLSNDSYAPISIPQQYEDSGHGAYAPGGTLTPQYPDLPNLYTAAASVPPPDRMNSDVPDLPPYGFSGATALPENTNGSTLSDTGFYTYPFSIMDAGSSGPMSERKARPIISWGFGGSLLTVSPCNATAPKSADGGELSTVRVYAMNAVTREGSDDDWIAASEAVNAIAYPATPQTLMPLADMCDRLANCSAGFGGRVAESRAALWRLLAVMCRDPLAWSKSASSAITGPSSVRLFGRSNSDSALPGRLGSESPLRSVGPSSRRTELEQGEAAIEVERLMTLGKTEEAFAVAQDAGLWSLAIVIAASSPDKELYHRAVTAFAKHRLNDGSALQTMCLAVVENDEEILRKATSPTGLDEWRRTVGVLLTSRRSSNDSSVMRIIERVGEALMEQRGDVVAAHVCFLLCGRLKALEPSGIPSGVALLGANPNAPAGRPRSFGSAAAVLQSLVFEAVVNVQSGATFPHLLPFRLVLAQEIAAVGRPKVALEHCESISSMVRTVLESGRNDIAALCFTPPFLASVEGLEERLRSNLGVTVVDSSKGPLTALGRSISSVFNRSNGNLLNTGSNPATAPLAVAALPPSTKPPSYEAPTPYIAPTPYAPPTLYASSPNQEPLTSTSPWQQPTIGAGVAPLPPAHPEPLQIPTESKNADQGRQRWSAFVSKTIGVLAPADGDLSPPPRPLGSGFLDSAGLAPPPIGLGFSAGSQVPAMDLHAAHNRSFSVGDVPMAYGDNMSASGLKVGGTAYGANAYGPGPGMNSGTAPPPFGNVPVQEMSSGGALGTAAGGMDHRRSSSDMTLQSQTFEKKPPLQPKCATASSSAKASDVSSGGDLSGKVAKGWRFRLSEKIKSAFTGPPKAHMGTENKFVFDKERGRWVIEGEEAEDDDDVPPPPPDDDAMFAGNAQAGSDMYAPHAQTNSGSNYDMSMARSQSVQDASSYGGSSQYDMGTRSQSLAPLSSAAGGSTPGSAGTSYDGMTDNTSETSLGSIGGAPAPHGAAASSVGNRYRAGARRKAGRRAYVDTFNSQPSTVGSVSAVAPPGQVGLPPGPRGVGGGAGGYKIFTPAPAPMSGTDSESNAGTVAAGSFSSAQESSGTLQDGTGAAQSTYTAPAADWSHSQHQRQRRAGGKTESRMRA